MGISLPGWLKAILQGGYEPQADEDKLYALADQCDACATYLRDVLPAGIDAAANALGSSYHGEAGIALSEFLKRYAHDANAQGPAAFAEATKQVGEFLRTMGDTIVRTKRELWIIGIVSWATILIGLGPILGTLIRKLGGEAVKRLLLEMVKRLVRRKATELRARMVGEMAATAATQTSKLGAFTKWFVPTALGEIADEVIPHTLAGLWGELTGQDRRLVVDENGRPTTSHSWDWRATAKTAVGALVGVPLAHGVGLALAKVPGANTFVGRRVSTFANNFVVSPASSTLTTFGFGEGWHNPTLQDALIAGGHGLARNSTDSTTHGPLELAGHWLGEQLVGEMPQTPPPPGPDGDGGVPVSPQAPSAAESAAPATARGTTPQAVPAGLLGGAVGGVAAQSPSNQGTGVNQSAGNANPRTANGAERDVVARRDQAGQAGARNASSDGGGPDSDTGTEVEANETTDQTAEQTADQTAEGTTEQTTDQTGDQAAQLEQRAPDAETPHLDEPGTPSTSAPGTEEATAHPVVASGSAAGQAAAVDAATPHSATDPGVGVAPGVAASRADLSRRLVNEVRQSWLGKNLKLTAAETEAIVAEVLAENPPSAAPALPNHGRDHLRPPNVPPDERILPDALRSLETFQQLSADKQQQVVEAVSAITGNDPAKVEGLRPLFESPGFRDMTSDELFAEVTGWHDYALLFGRAVELGAAVHGSPPIPDSLDLPSLSPDDATNLHEIGRREPLSSIGRAGQVTTAGEYAGVYSYTREDGSEWILKLFPDPENQQQKDDLHEALAAELKGLCAAARTGYGPMPYGFVVTTINNVPHIGLAMARVHGGIVPAHPVGEDAVAEFERSRAAVTFDTVLQLFEYVRRLRKLEGVAYHSFGELQGMVDDEGNFRPIDVVNVQPMVEDELYEATVDADYGLWQNEDIQVRDQLIDAAVENERRRQAALNEAAAQDTFDGLNLPSKVRDNVNVIVLPDQEAFYASYPHVEQLSELRRGHFQPNPDGSADIVVMLDANPTRADVEEAVLHEVGHLAFAASSPAEQAEMEAEIEQIPDTPLVRRWRQEIARLYTDHQTEELLARAYAQVIQEFGEVPSALRIWLDGFVTGTFGRLCVRLKLITPEQLQAGQSRREHDLAPLYGVLRKAVAGLRHRHVVHPANRGLDGDRASLSDQPGDHSDSSDLDRARVERSVRRALSGQAEELPGYQRGVRRILPLDVPTHLVVLNSGFAFEVLISVSQTPNSVPYWREAYLEDNFAVVTLSSGLAGDQSVAETLDAAFADLVGELRPNGSGHDPVVLTNKLGQVLAELTSTLPADQSVAVVTGRLYDGERYKLLSGAEPGTTIVMVSHLLQFGTERGVLRSALSLLGSPADREESDLNHAVLRYFANTALSDPAAPALQAAGIVRVTRLSYDSWLIVLPTGQSVYLGVSFDQLDPGVPFRLSNFAAIHMVQLTLPVRPGGPDGMAAYLGAALTALAAEYPELGANATQLVRWTRGAIDDRSPIARIAGDLYQAVLEDGTAYQLAITSGPVRDGTDFEVVYLPGLGQGLVRLSDQLDIGPDSADALARALDRLAQEASRAGVGEADLIENGKLPELPTGQGTFTFELDSGTTVAVDLSIDVHLTGTLHQIRFDAARSRLDVRLSPVLTRQEGRLALRALLTRFGRGMVPELPPAGDLFSTYDRTDADPARVLAAAEEVLGTGDLAEQIEPGRWRVTAGPVELELELTSGWVADGAPADATYHRGEDGRLRLRLTLSDLATSEEAGAVVRQHLRQLAVLAENPDVHLDSYLPFSHTVLPGLESLDDELDALVASSPATSRLERTQRRIEAILSGRAQHNVPRVRRIQRVGDGRWLITLENGLPVLADISADADVIGTYRLDINAVGRIAIRVSGKLSGDAVIATTLGIAALNIVEDLPGHSRVLLAVTRVARWAHQQLTDPGSAILRTLRALGVSQVSEAGEHTLRFRFTNGRFKDVTVVAGWMSDRPYVSGRLGGDRTPVVTLSHELIEQAPEQIGDVDFPAGVLSAGLQDALTGDGPALEDIEQFAEYVRQWWGTRNRRLTDAEVADIIADIIADLLTAGPTAQGRPAALTEQAEEMLAEAQLRMRELRAGLAGAPDRDALESAIHEASLQARVIAWLRRGARRAGPGVPAWQQQVVEELVPRDASGKPLRFSDAEVWGPATNSALPARDRNCAEAARAHVRTRYGEPTAAAPPAGMDGVSFAAADLEEEFGGRFQQLVEPADSALTAGALGTALDRLERTLRQAGHGATALLVHRAAGGGVGHVVVAEYNDAADTPEHMRGISYFEWGRDGRPRVARPDLAGAVTAVSAFVLDANQDAVPITDAGVVLGRGIGNLNTPSAAYAPTPAAYMAWTGALTAALNEPEVDDLPLAGRTDPLQMVVDVRREPLGDLPQRSLEGARAERQLAAAEQQLSEALDTLNAAPAAELAERESAVEAAADLVARRRESARAQRDRDAVADAVHQVESMVTNGSAVRIASEEVAAAQRRIDGARFVTASLRLRLGRAQAALTRARSADRRAILLLTRADGSTHRVVLRNAGGQVSYAGTDGQAVERGAVLREARSGVVTVQALVTSDDGTPLAFPWLPSGDQADAFARIGGAALAGDVPADPALHRALARPGLLTAAIPGVETIGPAGEGLLHVTTAGGQSFLLAVRRGPLNGLVAETRRVGTAGTPIFVTTIAPLEQAAADRVDLFRDAPINAHLDVDLCMAATAEEVAVIAALVDARAPVTRALADVSLDEQALSAVEEAVRSREPAALRAAADGLAGEQTGQVAAALRGAADRLGGEPALRPGFDVLPTLGLLDVRAVTAILVRRQRIDQPHEGGLDGRDQWQLDRMRARRLRDTLSAAGLGQSMLHRDERFALLAEAGLDQVVDIAREFGAKPGLAAKLPLTIDPRWVDETVPGLGAAVDESLIERIGPGTFRVHLSADTSFTVAVLLDGADVPPRRPDADLLLWLEAPLEARGARPELAARLRRLVEAHRQANGALDRVVELAQEHQSPLLTPRKLGGLARANPTFALDDHAVVGWLRAFREDHPAPNHREKRTLREFLYEKGLLASSPDYDIKRSALAAVDPEIVRYIEKSNKVRWTPLRLLNEAGADVARAGIPDFDATNLPNLVAWLRERQLPIALTGETVTVAGLEIAFAHDDELAPGHVQLAQGKNARSYVGLMPSGIDQHWGEQAAIHLVYAALAQHASDPDTLMDACRDAILARLDHQIATATARRVRRLLEGERLAFLAQLHLEDVDPASLPAVPANDWKRARKLAGSLALDLEQEHRAAIGRGEPPPSRVPPMVKYQTTTVMDQGGIGLVNAGVGMRFSGDSPGHASIAVAFALAQAWSYAIQYERTDAGAEARERAQLEGGDRTAHGLAAAMTAEFQRVLEPLLGTLASTTRPASPSPSSAREVWSARPHDLSAGTTSFKYQLTANLRLTAWTAAQSIVHVGIVNHQPELAITGATAAVAQLILKTVADRMLVGSRVANRVGLAAFEAAGELRERRRAQDALSRRLVTGVRELAQQAGIELPADAWQATWRDLADSRWSRPVATRRPNIAPDYQQCLRSRMLDRFAPNLIGAAAGLTPMVNNPVAAALQLGSGIVNTWMGAAIDAYYNNRGEDAMFRVANQLNAAAETSSRQQLDADLHAAFDSWWSAWTDGTRQPLRGERLPDRMVLPTPAASVMPTPWQAFGVTGVVPAIVEPAVQAALGMTAAHFLAHQSAWHQIGVAGTQTAVGSIAGPAGMWFLNQERAKLQARQEFYRRLTPQVAADTASHEAFRNLRNRPDDDGEETPLAGSQATDEVSTEDVALFVEYVRQWWSTRNRALTDAEVAAIAADLSEPGNENAATNQDDLRAAQDRMRELQADLARAEDGAALEPAIQAAYEQARLIAGLKRGIELDPRTPGPAWQQEVVEALVPRDPDGNPLRFTDADAWGAAVNSALPRRDRNCAPTAFAHARTRYGDPTAAAAPFDGNGIPFAAADLEAEFGGRFQQLVEPAGTTVTGQELDTALGRLEAALAKAGHGATAFVTYQFAGDGPGHVIVAEFNDADEVPGHKRGISYFDWENGGRVTRPDLAGKVTGINAFVIDGDQNAVPLLDTDGAILGRGRGNMLSPTPTYAPVPQEYVAWMRKLAGALGGPPPAPRTPLSMLHGSWESAIPEMGVQVGGLGSVVKALLPAQVGLGHNVVNLTRLPFGFGIDPNELVPVQVDGLRVLLLPSPDEFQTEQDLTAAEVRWSRAMSEQAVRAYRDWLADHPGNRPDVIHVHDEWMTPSLLDLADELGVPIVLTVHATEAGRHGGRLETGRGQGIHALEWELARRVDHVIVNSPAMRDEVAAVFAVPTDRITVVPNGVDLGEWVNPVEGMLGRDTGALRAEWNAQAPPEQQLPTDAPVLFFLGRLAEEKGVQDIVEALPAIVAAHPGTRLVVAGDGVHRGALEARVAELGLGDAVLFVGKGLRRDAPLQKLAMAADVAIMPSRYEPFGVVGLELMALGVPLVTSDVIGYVVDGQSGLRFPAGNVAGLAGKVIEVLGDPALRDHLASEGRRTASSETYRWENVAQQTVDVYRGVVRHVQRTPGPAWLPAQNAFDHVMVRVTRANEAYAELRMRGADGRELIPRIDDDGAFWHVPFDPSGTEATVALYENGELLHQRTVAVAPGQSRNHLWLRDTPPPNPVEELPLAGRPDLSPRATSDALRKAVDAHQGLERFDDTRDSHVRRRLAELPDHDGYVLALPTHENADYALMFVPGPVDSRERAGWEDTGIGVHFPEGNGFRRIVRVTVSDSIPAGDPVAGRIVAHVAEVDLLLGQLRRVTDRSAAMELERQVGHLLDELRSENATWRAQLPSEHREFYAAVDRALSDPAFLAAASTPLGERQAGVTRVERNGDTLVAWVRDGQRHLPVQVPLHAVPFATGQDQQQYERLVGRAVLAELSLASSAKVRHPNDPHLTPAADVRTPSVLRPDPTARRPRRPRAADLARLRELKYLAATYAALPPVAIPESDTTRSDVAAELTSLAQEAGLGVGPGARARWDAVRASLSEAEAALVRVLVDGDLARWTLLDGAYRTLAKGKLGESGNVGVRPIAEPHVSREALAIVDADGRPSGHRLPAPEQVGRVDRSFEVFPLVGPKRSLRGNGLVFHVRVGDRPDPRQVWFEQVESTWGVLHISPDLTPVQVELRIADTLTRVLAERKFELAGLGTYFATGHGFGTGALLGGAATAWGLALLPLLAPLLTVTLGRAVLLTLLRPAFSWKVRRDGFDITNWRQRRTAEFEGRLTDQELAGATAYLDTTVRPNELKPTTPRLAEQQVDDLADALRLAGLDPAGETGQRLLVGEAEARRHVVPPAPDSNLDKALEAEAAKQLHEIARALGDEGIPGVRNVGWRHKRLELDAGSRLRPARMSIDLVVSETVATRVQAVSANRFTGRVQYKVSVPVEATDGRLDHDALRRAVLGAIGVAAAEHRNAVARGTALWPPSLTRTATIAPEPDQPAPLSSPLADPIVAEADVRESAETMLGLAMRGLSDRDHLAGGRHRGMDARRGVLYLDTGESMQRLSVEVVASDTSQSRVDPIAFDPISQRVHYRLRVPVIDKRGEPLGYADLAAKVEELVGDAVEERRKQFAEIAGVGANLLRRAMTAPVGAVGALLLAGLLAGWPVGWVYFGIVMGGSIGAGLLASPRRRIEFMAREAYKGSYRRETAEPPGSYTGQAATYVADVAAELTRAADSTADQLRGQAGRPVPHDRRIDGVTARLVASGLLQEMSGVEFKSSSGVPGEGEPHGEHRDPVYRVEVRAGDDPLGLRVTIRKVGRRGSFFSRVVKVNVTGLSDRADTAVVLRRTAIGGFEVKINREGVTPDALRAGVTAAFRDLLNNQVPLRSRSLRGLFWSAAGRRVPGLAADALDIVHSAGHRQQQPGNPRQTPDASPLGFGAASTRASSGVGEKFYAYEEQKAKLTGKIEGFDPEKYTPPNEMLRVVDHLRDRVEAAEQALESVAARLEGIRTDPGASDAKRERAGELLDEVRQDAPARHRQVVDPIRELLDDPKQAGRIYRMPEVQRIEHLGGGVYQADVVPAWSWATRVALGRHRTKVLFRVTSGTVDDGTVSMWPVRDELDVIFVVDSRADSGMAKRQFEEAFAAYVRWTVAVNAHHGMVWPYAQQAIAGQAAAMLSKPGGLLDVSGHLVSWSARGIRIGAEGLVQAWNANENFQVRDRSKKYQQRFSGLPLPVDTLFTIHQTVGLHQRWARLDRISGELAELE